LISKIFGAELGKTQGSEPAHLWSLASIHFLTVNRLGAPEPHVSCAGICQQKNPQFQSRLACDLFLLPTL
jgi:hypothetical protein